jgi:CRISPR-associated endonuclease/helicase Cas3
MAGEFADEGLLGTSTLRGEFQDNQEWSKLPFRAAVVCGTVDMVGSRLLFSGYGDGAYSRSLHSGLLGNDTLVVFDECHLVPEFANILQLVEQAGGKLKPFHHMLMSATGDGQGTTIELSGADKKSPVLGNRLKAPKTLHLVNTDKPVIQQITILAQKDPPLRTIVFVQSPQDVSRIASSLRKNHEHGGVRTIVNR